MIDDSNLISSEVRFLEIGILSLIVIDFFFGNM